MKNSQCTLPLYSVLKLMDLECFSRSIVYQSVQAHPHHFRGSPFQYAWCEHTIVGSDSPTLYCNGSIWALVSENPKNPAAGKSSSSVKFQYELPDCFLPPLEEWTALQLLLRQFHSRQKMNAELPANSRCLPEHSFLCWWGYRRCPRLLEFKCGSCSFFDSL